MKHDVTEIIIGCAFTVHNILGAGFVEKVYENALFYELKSNGISVKMQSKILVGYKNIVVGEFYADLFVEDCCLVELKATKGLENIHHAQVMNYLRASGVETALLLNFGLPKLEIKRISM